MAPTTVQEERRELWNAILDDVSERDPDPARAAACSYLLDHLIRSAIPPDLNASRLHAYMKVADSRNARQGVLQAEPRP